MLILVLHGITGKSKLRRDSVKQRTAKFASARVALACASLLGTIMSKFIISFRILLIYQILFDKVSLDLNYRYVLF